jgi:hypothetical protein
MTTQNEALSLQRIQLRLLLKLACPPRRETLRQLAFSMVSHHTLGRSTGPLGFWSIDAAVMGEKARQNDIQRQTAIISSGLLLGIVVRNADGNFEVRP